MAKKQALGRGLSALLPDHPKFDQDVKKEQIVMISAKLLEPDPHQPRRNFDEAKLAELADSIREVGVMQPLLVVEAAKGYRIVAGERRYRAALLAGQKELPCLVRKYDDDKLAEVSLIENIQREDLDAMEEATAFRRLMDSFGYTQETLAAHLGKSRSYIANTLRLLQLPPQYRHMVSEGRLSPGHARAVLSLRTAEAQAKLVDAILSRDLSVRQAEALAHSLTEQAAPAAAAPKTTAADAHFRDLEKQFRTSLGLPVKLSGSLKKGRLVISYNSGDDLENLLDKLGR